MIQKEYSEQEALQRAAALCSSSEHCVSDIEEKLQRWGQSPEAQQRIVLRLIDEKYIDEARYARAYAHDRLRYHGWGRFKIDQMLRHQGIADAHRRQALESLPQEEYTATLHAALVQKRRSVKGNSDYEIRAKLLRFLLSRGFTMDEALEALDASEN